MRMEWCALESRCYPWSRSSVCCCPVEYVFLLWLYPCKPVYVVIFDLILISVHDVILLAHRSNHIWWRVQFENINIKGFSLFLAQKWTIKIVIKYAKLEHLFNHVREVLNYCVLYAKYDIYIEHLYNNKLHLFACLSQLKFAMEMEYNICKNQNDEQKFAMYKFYSVYL